MITGHDTMREVLRRCANDSEWHGAPTVVDLFAGAGGLSLGFTQAGFRVVAAYDHWPAARECYGSNFGHPMHDLDLSDVPTALKHVSRYDPDVLVGGPPCQDFSSAGTRSEGARASLTESFAQIGAGLGVPVIVMENVARTRTSAAYARARRTLIDHGYRLVETVLDASRCGTPQVRKRFFSVAMRAPAKTADRLTECLQDRQSPRPLTVAEYMGDELDISHYYRHPRTYARRAVYSIHEPSATIRGVNRPVAPSYPGHHLDPVPASSVRALTHGERARIQTFPSRWAWPEHRGKTRVEQLVGNAVPVALARFVARGMAEAI